MTELVVRKIAWEFDRSVPFLWQPTNPNFGIFCNAFTFIAVPFEKYIISSLRQAQDRLSEDPEVAAEAEAFLRQEAQHAAAHRKHMLALIERYPALEQCYQDTVKSYDDLITNRPVEFHAAYIANLEATFTPLFKVILDNRDALFGGSDQRVASLMMWHFVEEIEHRSSGLILYRHLSPDPWYRVKHFRRTFRHVSEVAANIAAAFDRHHSLRGAGRVRDGTDVTGPAGRRIQIPWPRWRPKAGPAPGSAYPLQRRSDQSPGENGVAACPFTDAPPQPRRPAAARVGGHLDARVRAGHRHDGVLRNTTGHRQRPLRGIPPECCRRTTANSSPRTRC